VAAKVCRNDTARLCRTSLGYLEPEGPSRDCCGASRLSNGAIAEDMHNDACKTILKKKSRF